MVFVPLYSFNLSFYKDTVLSPLLEQTERLEQNRVVVTYKQMAELRDLFIE